MMMMMMIMITVAINADRTGIIWLNGRVEVRTLKLKPQVRRAQQTSSGEDCNLT